MNFKRMFVIAGLMGLSLSGAGACAMQQQPPVQVWYQSQIHNSVKKLNTSFAYLIGATEDFESQETLAKYVGQTKKDLASLQTLLKNFNWCPDVLDKAFKQIDDKLVFDPNTAWTGSYVVTGLGQQFTLAQDMKNWLLTVCEQSDTKTQSIEYGTLQAMLCEKDYMAQCDSLKKEEKIFKQSCDYVALQYLIATKKNNQELGWLNTLSVDANSAWNDFKEIFGSELVTKQQKREYRNNLLQQEIQDLEDQADTYALQLKQKHHEYVTDCEIFQAHKMNHLKGLCTQVNSDTLIFKDNQGNYNEFFDLIWQLAGESARKNFGICERVWDYCSPKKYFYKIGADFGIIGVDFKTEYPGIDESKGQKIAKITKILDTVISWRDFASVVPAAPAIAAQALTIVLNSPKLCNAIVSMGIQQKIIDLLVNMKNKGNDIGFTISDVVKASSIIGDQGFGLLVKLCMQAIARQPELYAHLFDTFFEGVNTWIDAKGEPIFSSAKTALDDNELLTYVSLANKYNYVAPIHAPKPVEIKKPDTFYDTVVNKKTLGALGLGMVVYGSYRSGVHKWLLEKAKHVDVKESLSTLGGWAYAYGTGFLTK